MDLHPIRLVEFDQAFITGHTGSKSIEIMTTNFDQAAILCNLSEFLPNSTGIYLNGFTPNSNSTGQAYNVISMIYTQFKFDQSNSTGH